MMFLKKKFRECIKGVKYGLWIASSEKRSPLKNYAFSVQKSRRGAFKSSRESGEDKTDDDDDDETEDSH